MWNFYNFFFHSMKFPCNFSHLIIIFLGVWFFLILKDPMVGECMGWRDYMCCYTEHHEKEVTFGSAERCVVENFESSDRPLMAKRSSDTFLSYDHQIINFYKSDLSLLRHSSIQSHVPTTSFQTTQLQIARSDNPRVDFPFMPNALAPFNHVVEISKINKNSTLRTLQDFVSLLHFFWQEYNCDPLRHLISIKESRDNWLYVPETPEFLNRRECSPFHLMILDTYTSTCDLYSIYWSCYSSSQWEKVDGLYKFMYKTPEDFVSQQQTNVVNFIKSSEEAWFRFFNLWKEDPAGWFDSSTTRTYAHFIPYTVNGLSTPDLRGEYGFLHLFPKFPPLGKSFF